VDETQVPREVLPPGTRAPSFELPSAPDRKASLEDWKGKAVVLVFYPADWSPVCSDQLAVYNEILSDFKDLGAQLVGISVDGPWSHRAYAKARRLHFPLLSDFEPKGQVSRAYGAYDSERGVSERALFVLDPQGVIRWSYLAPVNVNPGAEGILAALEEMSGRQPAAPEEEAASWSSAGTHPH
jgi:peroxiredoxin